MESQKYHLLEGNTAEEGGSRHTPRFLSIPNRAREATRRDILYVAIVGIGAFISGVIFTLTLSTFQAQFRGRGNYERGFREEGLLPPDRIQLEEVRFKSPVDFETNGHEFLVTNPDDKAYVGDTTPEVDRAWEEMLWGRYFSISEAEAKSLWGSTYREFWDHTRSGYTGGFDMFHQLHCLNQIRQALHRDVYPALPIHGPVHTEHCIDHLRQSIMCWGSTSVVPLKYFEGYKSEYVKTDAVHTCRKFEPIREYVSERFNGSLFVPRPDGYVDTGDNAF